MAQLISIKLSRFEGSPWGFRLQGGKDFGTPLIVQKVNGSSPAEAAGLRAGDSVIKVNNTDMFNLRHKDAQDVIVRAGNSFEITVQRGGSTWRPSVSPVTPTIPSPQPNIMASSISPVTKTSLAAKKYDGPHIGSGHNVAPKPFPNGTVSDGGSIKSIVNKQYNSPVGIYSEQTIAETLSAQAEVLAGGVLGVNFKKNEKNYNAENSEVFKMVQEADKEPKTPEPPIESGMYGSTMMTSPSLPPAVIAQKPLETKPQPTTPTTPRGGLPPGQNICADCERLIVGVFVRIKEKNLHVECFKCSTCGTSLKNVGYYNINNKLYCDIHAKLVARQQAPSSGYVPTTTPPIGKAPAGTISAALGNHANYPSMSSHLNGTSVPSPFTTRRNIQSDYTDHGTMMDDRRRSSREFNYGYETIPSTNGFTNGNGTAVNTLDNNETTYTSTITIRTGNEVGVMKENDYKTPTTNFCTSKSFGGSNIDAPSSWTAPPTSNFNNSNLSRLQSQSITESYQAECNYFEEETAYDEPTVSSIEDNLSSRPASSVKCKSLQWPPIKSIEDITYPTAAPIWIDPNPVLDRRPRHNVPEKRVEIEENFRKSRSVSRTDDFTDCRRYDSCCWGEEELTMDQSSCNAPFYRKTECTRHETRETRASSLSRPSSADGRRSLTPTRITQPTPRPWLGGNSSDGTYGHVQAPVPPEPPTVCRKVCTCRIVCERTSGPAGPEHEQEHTYHEVRCELCNLPPQPPPSVEEPKQQEPQEIVCEEIDNEQVVDLSKLVPEDIAVCPKGVENQHNLYTETVEKDEGNIHIKKTTIYEKTVEVMSPSYCDGAGTPCGNEVEGFSGRKEHVESVDVISSAIETKQMMEEARREEEERRRMYEEECRREQEKIRMAEEEEERREQNRLKLLQQEKEEKERRRQEERRLTEKRCRQEEEERSGKHVSFSSSNETRSCQMMEKNICPTESYEREEYVRENRQPAAAAGNAMTEQRYREYKEEINIQENLGQVNKQEEYRQNLRDQVEVHKCLRQQEQPSATECHRPTLQERRLTNRFRPQSPPGDSSSSSSFQPPCNSSSQDTSCYQRKHVQFTQSQTANACQMPATEVKNATAKEWKSEMVKALTTAPARPYSPLQTSTNESWQEYDNSQSNATTKRMYSSEVRYEEVSRPIPQPPVQPPQYQDSDRPISPFTAALMTAPERPYTLLGEIEAGKPHDSVICVDRSETPIDQTTAEGYCHPAEILYTDMATHQSRSRERTLRKVEGPRPLPTPPPDYKFRDYSASPSRSLSRSGTPKDNRSLPTAGLKKPDTIPFYQKNLVATQQMPVESRPYTPSSRSSTPCRTKSPAEGPPEPPACHAKAPRITRPVEPKYPEQMAIEKHDEKYSCYYMKGETRQNCQSNEDVCKKQNSVTENYSQNQCQKNSSNDYECIEEISADESGCGISKIARFQPSLPCPVVTPQQSTQCPATVTSKCQSSQSAISERIQRTGVRVLPTPERTMEPTGQICESRRICHQEESITTTGNMMESNACANIGVTVLPCRAISADKSRAGVVIVPCDSSNGNGGGGNKGCAQGGIRITPTPDRGLCISPAVHGRSSSSCGGDDRGPRSGGCEIDIGNCPASGIRVGTCTDGSICIAPCKFPPGVASVKCPKPILKPECSVPKPIPFPHIPLPSQADDSTKPSCYESCPLNQSQSQNIPKSSSESNCSFQPINQQPRTNLSNQLTRLTIKRDKQHVVQLFKPQAVQSSQSCTDGSHCEPNNSINCSAEPKNSQCRAPPSSQHNSQKPISKTQNSVDPPNFSSHPDLGCGVGGGGGGSTGNRAGKFAGNTVPKRGRGILNHGGGITGGRQPMCGHCNSYVRGPFITALGQIWCPEHFVCVNSQCRRPLQDIGFVEEKGQLYCEYCFERFIAPQCYKCNSKIKGDCLNAIGKHYHPECFKCTYCGKLFGNSPFFLEEGLPYCEADWNELFTTKCFACGFPVEAGDRWVEALNNNYHSQCFNCTMCQKNLEGQSFYAKAGRPFCKNHAR